MQTPSIELLEQKIARPEVFGLVATGKDVFGCLDASSPHEKSTISAILYAFGIAMRIIINF